MAVVKVNLNDLTIGKSLPFDLVTSAGALVIPKNVILSVEIFNKLSDTEVFAESVEKMYGLDLDDEAKAAVTNTLSNLNLGKEVQSFNIFNKEANGYSLLKCEYIGWIKDLALVIEMPRQGNGEFARLYQLDPGQKIQAKMHIGSNEYIFQTFVISVTQNPLPIAFIKHPATVKVIKLRNSNRKEVKLAGKITVDNVQHNIVVIDMSDSGAAFLSDLIIEKSKSFIFTIHLKIDGVEQSLNIPVKIRNCKGLGTKHRYGVSFDGSLSAEDKIFLQSFIYTL